MILIIQLPRLHFLIFIFFILPLDLFSVLLVFYFNLLLRLIIFLWFYTLFTGNQNNHPTYIGFSLSHSNFYQVIFNGFDFLFLFFSLCRCCWFCVLSQRFFTFCYSFQNYILIIFRKWLLPFFCPVFFINFFITVSSPVLITVCVLVYGFFKCLVFFPKFFDPYSICLTISSYWTSSIPFICFLFRVIHSPWSLISNKKNFFESNESKD